MVCADHEPQVAFPKLDPAEIEVLSDIASRCTFKDGERIFSTGDRGVPLYVVESGEIDIVDESAGEPHTIAIHRAGEFSGDVSLLTDRPSLSDPAGRRGPTLASKITWAFPPASAARIWPIADTCKP